MSSSDTPFQDSDPSDFERNLRRVLQARAPGTTPDALRTSIPLVVTERVGVGRRIRMGLRATHVERRRSRLAAFGAMGLALVFVTAVVALGLPVTQAPGIGMKPSGASAVAWHDDAITLTATSVTIEAGGQVFAAPEAPLSVHSDPGNATYRTLELGWDAGGHEMRLYFYFKADGVNWWASQIRTYDGQPTPDWIYYQGPFLKTPIGQSYRGDLDILSSDGKVPGHLLIAAMSLGAFQPNDGPQTLQNCHAVGPTSPPNGSQTDPMAPGQPLADAGLGSMSPQEISQLLQAKRYCYTFRLDWQYAGNPTKTADRTTGFSQVWCVPPNGTVSGFEYGSSGELIVVVTDPTPHTFDPNTPTRVGC